MKIRIFALIIFLTPFFAAAQTATTRDFLDKHADGGVMTIYFYKNTLKMLNQTDSKEFDEMIKGIEKLRFMVIDKSAVKFASQDYKKLVDSYKGEEYAQMMTSRMNGKNFDVYMKDKKGSPLGTIILVNDSSSLYVMDMIGTIDLSKASKVFSEIDQNSDISKKIKGFLNKDKEDKKEDGEDPKGKKTQVKE